MYVLVRKYIRMYVCMHACMRAFTHLCLEMYLCQCDYKHVRVGPCMKTGLARNSPDMKQFGVRTYR